MAITGTKVASSSNGNKSYFVNKCTISEITQQESQYSDTSLKVTLEDSRNGYSYTCFINQNFEKDTNGIVTDLKFPDDVNTLYLAAGKDLNVSDVGEINVDKLEGAQVACLSYESTGKYKRAIWSVMSSWDDVDKLEAKFAEQVKKGYPKNYKKGNSTDTVMVGGEKTAVDDLPF
tara:strand:+ start:5181 stop:5705 length:525 start_codon:yes stop_codon:yes gene_type:complete